MKVTIKTSRGFEYTYKKILYFAYAGPRHIDLVKSDMNNIRIWPDKVTGLFKEIIMEEDENDNQKDQ